MTRMPSQAETDEDVVAPVAANTTADTELAGAATATSCTTSGYGSAEMSSIPTATGSSTAANGSGLTPDSGPGAAASTPSSGSFGSSSLQPLSVAMAVSNAGLHNLRNTCFMCSAVACLGNVGVLRDYFLSQTYKDSIKVKGLYTEKTQGRFAEGFYELLAQIWNARGSSTLQSSRRFKCLIENHDPMQRFYGHRQHDVCEFLEFVIDALKEDCNMVKGKKPYVERKDHNGRPDMEVALEAANDFVIRNDSFIDDLFVGFHKSVINCPEESCRRESIVFEPFLSLKLELQNKAKCGQRAFAVTVVRADSGVITRINVSLDKNAFTSQLVSAVADQAGLLASSCILIDVYKGMAFKYFKDRNRVQEIADSDNIVLYELDDAHAGIAIPIAEGDRVLVAEDFESDSKKAAHLVRGMYGRTVEVDEAGDAKIQFAFPDPHSEAEITKSTWVFKAHFDCLVNLDSAQRRVSAKDGQQYTILEVKDQEHLGGDVLALLDLWQHEMKPTAPMAACVIHFRRRLPVSSSFDGPLLELVGAPIFTCSPRSTTIASLREAVGTALVSRFGEESRSGWTLYESPRTDERALRFTNDVIVLPCDHKLSKDHEQTSLQFSERAYFVLEWADGAPQQVVAALEQVAEVKPPDNSVDLQTCFEWYTEAEQVGEQDEVYCSGCKAHRRVFKRLEMWSLPPVLVLQLKRFEFEPNGMVRRKLHTPVNFPLDGLDLSSFCGDIESFPQDACLRAGQMVQIHGLQSAAGQKLNGLVGKAMYLDPPTARFCVRMQEDDPSDVWKKLQPSNLRPVASEGSASKVPHPPIFDLCAASKHLAFAEVTSFGHYVSYARSSEDGLWRLFDDEDVKEVSADMVEAERSGAYVLFYLRRDLRPESWGPPG